ncbi:unknown protein [Azorhizobium caulinodans ORS 571]|uniref:Uncharacterized protein n=1 Tax=Azorhizobium caulinodans (strain ATCC 43989 / DSM 5975 / JCM 20966 / LMG 6465 / NBRC 14845 / NCIMB 13405 / ORS 571) TaxID=438753 RepID=A8HTF0_AZOC5|nr:hypothetical protein [Azorhizobium caulinodans]BAF86827.1 unknown protein [Azorhizobium caulinodans ORS 571]
MDDVVERLRVFTADFLRCFGEGREHDTLVEAIAEIEALRLKVAKLKKMLADRPEGPL